jgi:hypothetical protein
MFYIYENWSLVSINCGTQPNPDISGIGVRIALYLPAVLSIFLRFKGSSATDVILTYISVQVAALS